ncbi:hypothetical protein [Novosphingobium sp. MMS21-SN21R]|uniref:hypothetical protein n=1 Tax=Novosphingobium sp. MMS21-SN21R TaxID=2969298 RepID=UPI002884A542|nr:hypothetical protein [Novosphingobium sp. MMS21-SN21R]MDT0510167.1 hypothetical protein [Novosphingobium sp. MMS21-SN21R]
MARHELGANQIRNSPADIGTSDGKDLFLDSLLDTRVVEVAFPGQAGPEGRLDS